MANDLTAMVARIAAETARPDLALAAPTAGNPNGAAIRNAITTAITEYQKQRFRFSDINPGVPTTFNTVASQSVYSISDNANIASIFYIEYLNLALGNTIQQLQRVTPETQHLNIQLFNQKGFPSSYAYEGNSVILYPVPDIIYTLYLGGHILVAAPASDSEVGNKWMTDAELLIRSRAKYEIAVHVTRNPSMAAAMSPDAGENGQAYRAFKSLKSEGNKATGRGKIKSMNF